MSEPSSLFPKSAQGSSVLAQDPSNPQTYFNGFNQFTHSEYFIPVTAVAALLAYQFMKGLKGPRKIEGSAYWAKAEHIKRAKELCLKSNASADPFEVSFQLGNIPLFDVVTSAPNLWSAEDGEIFRYPKSAHF